MASAISAYPSAQSDGRVRKAHTKSRKGCGNCKLRRVKCDEGKPGCDKCKDYGVQCDYGSCDIDSTEGVSLQLPGEASFTISTRPANQPSSAVQLKDEPKDSLSPMDSAAADAVSSMINKPLALHDSPEAYCMTKEDLATMRRFQYRTVFTIGTASTVPIYRDHIVKMAARENASYLIHVILTLTIMHDRFLEKPWTSQPSAKESFHSYHGTAIFNSILSMPIEDEHRDPLWATAALLGACTIADMQASNAQEAWPLKPASPADLDWLRMSDGKKEVWRLVDPLRPDSLFRDALSQDRSVDSLTYTDHVPEMELLYPFLTKITSIDPSHPSTPEETEDPYHTAASILVRLLELECNHNTIMYFLSFLGHMDPRFRQLLHAKDPRAMLILVWWYGKMCQYNVWWMQRRMRIEGQAICLYLEKNHGDEEIVKLLDFPRMMTGLDVS